MTQNQFAALCEEHLVAPAIALENPAVRNALKARDDEAVIRALEEREIDPDEAG